MKSCLSLLALLLLMANLSGIVCLPGSGQSIDAPDRAYHLAYHNSNDDLHFYGSGFWAVRFDFANYYFPNLPDLSFTINGLRLWFPQTGDSVKVKLMTDVEGQPGLPQLADLRAPVTSNLVQIPLSAPVTVQQIWMVVEYSTNFSNRFVSASRGGGTRSYYLNTSMTTPYYQSLASAGFNAELLFGVEGEFADLTDLRLMDLALEGDITPGATVYPRFRIHNHSPQPLSQVSLNLSLLTPEEGSNLNRTITIPDLIPAYGDLMWDQNHPAYFGQAIELPGEAMQMRLRGVLNSELGTADYSGNNTLDRYYYSFTDTSPVLLSENFFRASNAASLIGLQDQVLANDLYRSIHSLTYFPVLADTLSAPGAVTRFSWYGFNATPRVVLGGKRRVMGIDAGFQTAFQTRCDSLLTDKSFISAASVVPTYNADAVALRFTFENQNTRFLSGTGVYDLVRNSMFFAGLFRRVQLEGVWFWVFDRWINHATPITETLDIGQSLLLETQMARTGLDLASEYRVYYWIQERNAGPIFHAGYQQLVFPTSVDDHLLQPPVLNLAPNPLRGKSMLRVSLGSVAVKAPRTLSVYNLRGQLIHSQSLTDTDTQVQPTVFPTSGIYFIRVVDKTLRESVLKGRITVIK